LEGRTKGRGPPPKARGAAGTPSQDRSHALDPPGRHGASQPADSSTTSRARAEGFGRLSNPTSTSIARPRPAGRGGSSTARRPGATAWGRGPTTVYWAEFEARPARRHGRGTRSYPPAYRVRKRGARSSACGEGSSGDGIPSSSTTAGRSAGPRSWERVGTRVVVGREPGGSPGSSGTCRTRVGLGTSSARVRRCRA